MGDKLNNYLKSRMGKSQIIALIALILFFLIRNRITTESLLLYIGFLAGLFIIVLVESLLPFKDSLLKIIRPADSNKTPRIFEFGFFFFLFLATIVSGFAAAEYYTSDASFQVLLNFWYFTVFYGFGFGCGYYHYIRRIDN